MLVKKGFFKELFPKGIPDFSKEEGLDKNIIKKIRVIPISESGGCRILYGLKPDSVMVIKKKRTEKINLTIAFDKEGGSYGGFNALIPASALTGT